MSLNLSKKTDTILLDLIHLYTVTKVKVNNKAASFYQHDDKIFITNATGFEVGNQKVLVEYNGIPPVAIKPPWDGGFTWAKDKNGNDWMSINIQGEGGKMYYPCKDHPSDEPNEGADLKITIPSNLMVAIWIFNWQLAPPLIYKRASLRNHRPQDSHITELQGESHGRTCRQTGTVLCRRKNLLRRTGRWSDC